MFEIYNVFGPVAFIPEDFSLTTPSQLFILGILFNNIKKAALFLKTIKDRIANKEDFFFRLINYLYCEKGIVLVNRSYNSTNFKYMFNNYKIDDVLIIGTYSSNKRFIDARSEKTKLGTIMHCSPKNQQFPEYMSTWFLYDDLRIKKVENIDKTSFEKYSCLSFIEE